MSAYPDPHQHPGLLRWYRRRAENSRGAGTDREESVRVIQREGFNGERGRIETGEVRQTTSIEGKAHGWRQGKTRKAQSKCYDVMM